MVLSMLREYYITKPFYGWMKNNCVIGISSANVEFSFMWWAFKMSRVNYFVGFFGSINMFIELKTLPVRMIGHHFLNLI